MELFIVLDLALERGGKAEGEMTGCFKLRLQHFKDRGSDLGKHLYIFNFKHMF